MLLALLEIPGVVLPDVVAAAVLFGSPCGWLPATRAEMADAVFVTLDHRLEAPARRAAALFVG